MTSDYKLINKDTIHRIFSVDHPSLRHIPGIFIYDCCDGSNDKNRDKEREEEETEKKEESKEKEKEKEEREEAEKGQKEEEKG